jgi:hypothetical protein
LLGVSIGLSFNGMEYKMMIERTKKRNWFEYIFWKIGMMDNNIITTHCHNECYMEISNNPIFHANTEHIKMCNIII